MKLESRHLKNRRNNGGHIIRMLAMVAVLLGFVLMMRRMPAIFENNANPTIESSVDTSVYWPDSDKELIRHSTFVISYDTVRRQPEWVAYELSADSLRLPAVDSPEEFIVDEKLSRSFVTPEDYEGSDWIPGQLISPEDRAWNRQFRQETFLLSTVSPQDPLFRYGIWRELDENVRDWVREEGKMYVVTGPIFGPEERATGENQIPVPSYFFKVILDLGRAGKKGIGFLLPNERSDRPLMDYAGSIRAIEEVTGFDFFHQLTGDPKLEDAIEKYFTPELWPVDSVRYQRRVREWNQKSEF